MAQKRALAPNASSPLLNAAILTGALGYSLFLLVDRGRLAWPPHELLRSLTTVAGCLALVGPLLLLRHEGEVGIGEQLWMTGGLLIWVHDAAAVLSGGNRSTSWSNPLGVRAMGLVLLAVLIACWRLRGPSGERDWSWKNVIGWLVGAFWIATGLIDLATSRPWGPPIR